MRVIIFVNERTIFVLLYQIPHLILLHPPIRTWFDYKIGVDFSIQYKFYFSKFCCLLLSFLMVCLWSILSLYLLLIPRLTILIDG